MTKAKNAGMRKIAGKKAQAFLLHEKEYQLGFIEAEQSNSLTRGLGETARQDAAEAVRMVFAIDGVLADTFVQCAEDPAYHAFAARVEGTLRAGGRIILSGCGATGRLCLNLEAGWRRALQALQKENPGQSQALLKIEDQVVTIMTGGDFALIKSVECFEDFAALGRQQVDEMGVGKGDLLIGITATAETTSILGTAMAASGQGAQVEMVVCSDPAVISERIRRAREVFEKENVHSLYLPCGAMAVTGSTRMQSATIEQLACGSALQEAMIRILRGLHIAMPGQISYAAAFKDLTTQLLDPSVVSSVAGYACLEADTYQKEGLITYFADEYLLDVLSDTTERSPTFMVPPFAAAGMPGAVPSWAFVKNPDCATEEAWKRCLMREARCINWTREDYERFQVKVDPVPKIGREDLFRYQIGRERDEKRENNAHGVAVWIDQHGPCPAFEPQAKNYGRTAALTLDGLGIALPATPMKLFEHLAIKIILNTVSTVTMARLGRLTSNFMTWMDMSNKKLIDRSARLIAQECGIGYEKALHELFYSEALAAADRGVQSPAQITINRLKNK